MGAILSWLATPQAAATLLTLVVTVKTVIDGINLIWSKKDADASAKADRLAQVEKTAILAWHAAEGVAEATGQGKLADYLNMLERMITSSGLLPLTDAEKAHAKEVAATLSKAAKSPIVLNLNDTSPLQPMPLPPANLAKK